MHQNCSNFQLQNDDLIIGKEVLRQVLEDAGKDIQQIIKNERNAYKAEDKKRKLDLIDTVNTKVQENADERTVSSEQLKMILKASEDTLARAQEIKQEIKDMGEQRKHSLEKVASEGIKNVKTEKENALEEIQKAKQSKCTN